MTAAHGIRAVANANMARALRSVSVERGRDPRDFALMVFGGSAALHGVELARMLDIGTVIVPDLPGVFTAVGMLTSDVEHHLVRPLVTPLCDLGSADGQAVLDDLRGQALAALERDGFAAWDCEIRLQCDLRYRKQALELTVPLTGDRLQAATLDRLRADFEAAYEQTFGYRPEREEPETVNLRAIGIGRRAGRLDFAAATVDAPPAASHEASRPVSFARDAAPIETAVRARTEVGPVETAGPLILESYESTIVIPPGASVRRDDFGNLVITP